MSRCSVALCTYNGARYLAAQLDSIAGQSRRPDEIVACDDASTDGSQEILHRFSAQAPFPVRLYCNDVNAGVTKNFESAIRRCQGDWIALSDQDDVWHPSKLASLEAALADPEPAGAVFTDADVVDDALRPLGYSLWDAIDFGRRRRDLAREGRLLDVLLWRNVVTGATLAFRSEHRELFLPIPDDWMHDAWLALVLAAFVRVVPLAVRTISYRQHVQNRIGARRPTLASRLRQLVATEPTGYLVQKRQLDEVCEQLKRLGGSGRTPPRDDVPSLIRRKMAHLEARGRMPTRRWQRIPSVARELAVLNYRRFSSGWLSALADLALPAPQRGASTNRSE